MVISSAFIQKVAANKHFKIVDAVSGHSFNWQDVENAASIPPFQNKLVFLYLDYSALSLLAFFHWYAAGAALVLLPQNLQLERKSVLEGSYAPEAIVDTSRTTITDFVSNKSGLLTWFQSHDQKNKNLVHPDIKILLSTSGTTGSPKLVKLSEANLLANAAAILQYLPIATEDITPLNLPIYYSYGLSVLTTHAIGGGTMVCNLADIIQRTFWQQWELFGFTSLAGVPFSYEMLNRLGFFKKELPTLRYFTQAGGKLHEPLVTKAATYAAETNKQFYVMYGQTEATARMSYLPPSETLSKPNSIGIAIPGGKFLLNDETGELLYSGNNVFGGYAEKLADLSEYEQQSVLKTGDIAQIDEDGYVFITGRIKRFVKLFGNRISLDEVETLIKTKFNLHPLACNGAEDAYLLISYTDPHADEKNIVAFLFSEFGIHPTVIKWNRLLELPLTANGKIDYQQIQQDYDRR